MGVARSIQISFDMQNNAAAPLGHRHHLQCRNHKHFSIVSFRLGAEVGGAAPRWRWRRSTFQSQIIGPWSFVSISFNLYLSTLISGGGVVGGGGRGWEDPCCYISLDYETETQQQRETIDGRHRNATRGPGGVCSRFNAPLSNAKSIRWPASTRSLK